jgi:hypothetical protein
MTERSSMTVKGFGASSSLPRLDAAVGVNAATDDLDVRLLVVAMFGDPFAGDDQNPDGGQSVPIRASFVSFRASSPVTDPQKRYLALEGMRVASDSLFTEMSLGLDLADAMDALADRRDAGDQVAASALTTVLEAADAARAAREGER